jgi:hypothetical protein
MNTKQDNPVYETIEFVDGARKEVVTKTEKIIEPYRKSAGKRFPVLFALLATSGVSATLFGIERLIIDITWLNDRPIVVLIIGVLILALTGTLYKKLG